MSPDSLPVRLRQARGALTLSQAGIRAGVPEDRIREYEEGARRPYGKTLKRLADAYGLSVPDLIGTARASSAPAVQSPPARRRRRRREAGALGQAEAASVQIPIPLDGSRELRLVIELVIRPGSSARATIRSVEAEGQTSGAATTPTAAPAAPTTVVSPAAAAPSIAQPTETPPRPQLAAEPEPVVAAVRPQRRPIRVALPGRSGLAAGGSDDSRDPLGEFRRAYHEFRRDRK